MSTRTGLSEEIRFRVPLPLVIPVGALALIGGITFGMSRILLSVPKEIAVILALGIAANVLGVCTYIALRPASARASWGELLVVGTYPIVIAVVIALIGLESGGHATGAPTENGAPAAPGNAVSAAGVAFDTAELNLTAGEETEITFTNEDTVPHNISIYQEQGGKQLFKGEVINGGQDTTYQVPALEKGEYYFQCDVHPAMSGTVTVV